nr:hypothetical protein [Tanacetum cinerariifolium]
MFMYYSGVALTKEILLVDNITLKVGTLENLLMWARNHKYDFATFLCEVMIDKVRTKKSWNYPLCRRDKCKKGNLDRKDGRFWCDSCEDVEEGASSATTAGNDNSKASELERLNKAPAIATPSKPSEEKKRRREELEDSDEEASFVVDSQPKEGDVACSSDMRKRK